VNTAPQHS